MSLLSDPDYLIHNLRLAYLRHVDDPYGPRVLALNPAYTSNAHIIASGLADQELWPEIVMPSSPTPANEDTSRDANKQHSGFPGARGLKYSQTIVGPNRTGAMGMRVSGKRGSLIREQTPVLEANGTRHRSDSAPTPVSSSPVSRQMDSNNSILIKRKSVDVTQLEEAPTMNSTVKAEPFRPPFTRAEEMEARRNIRMRSRFSLTGNTPGLVVASEVDTINPDVSEDEELTGDDLDMLVDDIPLDEEEVVEGDFFDHEGEFGPRVVLASSTSDGILSTTNSVLSISHSSGAGPLSTSHLNVRSLAPARLSPVQEGRPRHNHLIPENTIPTAPGRDPNVTPQRTYKSDGSYFELVVPPTLSRVNQGNGVPQSQSAQVWVVEPASPVETADAVAPINAEEPISNHTRQHSTLTFARVKVLPVPSRPLTSALSQILASKAQKADNPFSELYSLISSRSNSLSLSVIYPFSTCPTTPVMLTVRNDATVEEVIGFALWTYWEEGLAPKLDEDVGTADDSRRNEKLSAAGWSLRITEDGEVDDDFPAMDRMAKILKFDFEGYAIMPETPVQAEQNRLAESKIQRRPSRIMIAKKRPTDSAPQTLAPPGPSTGVTSSSVTSVAPMSSSIGGGSTISQGPQQFLRVKVAEKADAHFSTTIPVKESMYMEEVLENVCRKRKINDPKEWCLVYELKILVPLDRTVASLQGKKELFLVKSENLAQYEIPKQQTRSTDPNASIFSRISEVPEQHYSAALDFTTAYKKYTVYRKMPMLVVRHERILAMDGDYIHIMPSATRAFLDSMKTSSYHIKAVIACMQSARTSSNFKLVVWRDGGNKRYDFEAESPKVAAEIVRNIKDLKTKRLERSITLNRSRRNRQAV